ncbi:MAG: hypothetical protein JWP03_256 [Phycisphaerales bacterium]|nr:hypothetical protein [Phycisphaerales bacterium]
MNSRIRKQFAAIGARAVVVEAAPEARGREVRAARWTAPGLLPAFSIDIRVHRDGEYFELHSQPQARVEVLDVDPLDRHLLLEVRTPACDAVVSVETYLCGHDRGHWFVAPVPERTGARDVQGAKDALRPHALWDAMLDEGIPQELRGRLARLLVRSRNDRETSDVAGMVFLD